MGSSYDVIVLGLGAMGSSAAYQLSRKRVKVLGLERFSPPHDLGSSHGQTRIIREAYFEDPRYVPLIQRAYELWDELERVSATRLCHLTGGVMIGPPNGALLQGALASAQAHRLEYRQMTAAQIHDQFPALRPPPSMAGLWEPRSGILFPEVCIKAHLTLAQRQGAELRFQEKVLEWSAHGDRVQVRTDQSEYEAGRLILAAGSWLPYLWPQCPVPLRVERQTMFWLSPRKKLLFEAGTCPVHVWEHEPNRIFYGFPNLGQGVKLACHDRGPETHPDFVDREVDGAETAGILKLADLFLPDLGRTVLNQSVCLYTRTPDGHFLIDRHPRHPQVLIASPCSGHGFKFSSVIGEILADLARDRQPPFDLSLFGLHGRQEQLH